ncbi:MAG: hypothetical protein M1835_002886 [Candelina submexicana]|nr:MAG: hypothetical protein M1835_002886 [Candelina submexicana]
MSDTSSLSNGNLAGLDPEFGKGETVFPSDDTKTQFPFLRLPPEIRNQIYHYIVGGQIIFVRDMNPEAYAIAVGARPAKRYRSWPPKSRPRRASYDLLPRQGIPEDSLNKYRTTYCRAKPNQSWVERSDSPYQDPHIGIMAVCRQTYQEAGSIFYSWCFYLDLSSQGALAFLKDRPSSALQRIRKLGLRYDGNDDRTVQTQPSITPSKAWRELCKFIRTQSNVQELQLYLVNFFFANCSNARHVSRTSPLLIFTRVQRGFINGIEEEEWIRQLTKIRGLSKLKLTICRSGGRPSARGRALRNRYFLERADAIEDVLKAKMLRAGGEFISWRHELSPADQAQIVGPYDN